MVEEAYVSFETAKLLKEKGFKPNKVEKYGIFYGPDHEFHYLGKEDGFLMDDTCVITYTLAVVMRWLREVHNIGIFPSTYTLTNCERTYESHPYGTAIVNLNTYELMTDDIMPRDSYEEACEAAIKYCLENLI